MRVELKPKPLTKKAFKKFGEVIELENRDSKIINNGYAQKFYELCTMDANEKGGSSTLHIYIGKNREFPLHINMLEKHPFFSQTFMPRSTEPFLCVVALGDEKPDFSTIQAFVTNGNQGVHYNRGVWHFPLICLKNEEQFIVIDRTNMNQEQSKVVDCIEYEIEEKEIFLIKE
ncbi:ureidoglycolate hydrolase [Arcobacter sp. CECT 8983]|uniref:ureidoglycolate lyase n=1 Tax=Arcobacter sp. CECT 8983 TaxID=2044508 RepID=UPI00100BB97B|nr:ureidoglycolate lyase [Arcobacter sp. CECT 8983]RXJ91629.1 ureidoglycolate hydrolase [Arcobacter sp. CECT 8983]